MRMLKFAKYLPEFGWQPFILTERKNKIVDDSLVNELPPDVFITYVAANSPQQKKSRYKESIKKSRSFWTPVRIIYWLYRIFIYSIYAFYRNYIMAPDKSLPWAIAAYKKTIELHQQYKFDLMLTSGPPFSPFRIGIKLKEILQIPWVLDFRDGWIGNPLYSNWKRFFIRWQNQMIEKRAIALADLSVFATSPLYKIYRNRYPKNQSKMSIIHNGFDAADFANLKTNKQNNNTLHFLYSGSVDKKRSPRYFLRSVEKVLAEVDGLNNHLKITFIGAFKDNPEFWLKKLDGILSIKPYMAHKEALTRMTDADVFLLFANPAEGGQTIMTGKIFEYLALNKPIFGIANPCAATELLEELNTGYFAKYHDEHEIKNQIIRIVNDWKSGRVNPATQSEKLFCFERKQLTKKLSQHLNEIISD